MEWEKDRGREREGEGKGKREEKGKETSHLFSYAALEWNLLGFTGSRNKTRYSHFGATAFVEFRCVCKNALVKSNMFVSTRERFFTNFKETKAPARAWSSTRV